MEEGRQHAPWLEVRGNHDNFDVKTRGGPQDRAQLRTHNFYEFSLLFKGHWKQKYQYQIPKLYPNYYHANPLGIRFLFSFLVT